jgi:hypothetical protein
LVRLLAPESLPTWLVTYFRGAAATRFAGAGYDPRMWYKPGWFYLSILFKSQLFGLPLLYLGISDVVRRRRFLTLGCLAWLLGPVLVLSLFKVKEAPYICSAYPALAILMACGFQPFFRSIQSLEVMLSTLASVAFAMFFFAVGALTWGQFILLLPLYAIYLIAAPMKMPLFTWRRRATIVAAVASLLFADGVVVSRQLQHQPHSRDIASYFRPRLGPFRAGAVVFTAPEYPAIGFYLFRQGEYWDVYTAHNSDELFRYDLENGNRMFYVVDPSQTIYGARLKPEWIRLLKRNTRDITADVERATGAKLSLRVLVPLTEPRP